MSRSTDDLVDGFLSHLTVERGLSVNTVAAYRRDLARYLSWLRGREITAPAEVRQTDVMAYIRALAVGDGGVPLAAPSIARALAAVRMLHRFAVSEGVVAEDVTKDVTMPRLDKRLPKALPIAEVQRLLDSCDTTSVSGLRDRCLLELLYGTGARISEVTALDVDDIGPCLRDADRGLRLHGKGSKERQVPLGSFARQAVDAWLVRGRPLFASRAAKATPALLLNSRGGRLSRQSAWAVVRGAGERSGVSAGGVDLSPHTLRHSYATHLLEGGADVRAVQELLGHASVTTTQIYTLVTIDHLREVYLTAHPRAN